MKLQKNSFFFDFFLVTSLISEIFLILKLDDEMLNCLNEPQLLENASPMVLVLNLEMKLECQLSSPLKHETEPTDVFLLEDTSSPLLLHLPLDNKFQAPLKTTTMERILSSIHQEKEVFIKSQLRSKSNILNKVQSLFKSNTQVTCSFFV